MGNDLSGRRALVTGGGHGIGAAIALALAGAGADVAAGYGRSGVAAQNVVARAAEHGVRTTAIGADVTVTSEVDALVAQAVEFLGGLDILVCNAGHLVGRQTVEEMRDEHFDAVVSVNLGSTFRTVRAAIPHLRRNGWGHIVSMSQPVDLDWLPGHIAYGISKMGMTMMALGLAGELAPDNIAVNALWPVTIVESQASKNWALGDPSMWRKADILADCVVEIVKHEPAELTGQALLDEPFLRSLGVTDFERYNVVPGSKPPALEDLWEGMAAGRAPGGR